jgi:hypothetical protein
MILSRALILAAGSIPLVATVVIALLSPATPPLPSREEAFVPCPTGSAEFIDLSVPERLAGDDASAVPRIDAIPAEFAAALPVPETFKLTSDRFRVPFGTLRRSDFEVFRDKRVRLTLIVGTSGDLLFAMPTAGPKELFEDALRFARGMKIKPILRDGKPILARIDNFEIAVGSSERRPAKPNPLPAIEDWQSLRIGYSEKWIGVEKQFQLEIRGDGTVTYLGRNNVALLGRHCARISRTAVERLVGAFRTAEFLDLDEKYRGGFSHGPLIHTSIAFDGVGKTVEVFSWGSADMPDAVEFLQFLVMEVAGGRRWTNGNAGTVAALRAEGWDFKRQDPANTSMIAGVARLGDGAAVADLIAAGSPLGNIDGAAGEEWLLVRDNPLVSAANRGAFDIVDALLRTNQQWRPVVLGHALVAGARFGDVAFCREMLRRGAPVSSRDAQGKTAVMSAAESGVPEIVAVMLDAGARPNEADEEGETALHWVGKDAPFDRLEPSAMNRRAVVDLLVRAGADVDAYDRLEFTPLTEALNERPEVVTALIANGADVNRRVGGDSTALMADDNPETMSFLLEAGADPLVRDEYGRTALEALKARNEQRRESSSGQDRGAYERGLRAQAVLERWISTHPKKTR